jgi:hypothetical protein
MARHKPDTHTLGLFGAQLLPEISHPSTGHIARPEGEWVCYCKGMRGFNAVMPASWCAAYSEGIAA